MSDRLTIFQYAYFVDDVFAAAERWAAVNGAGPFFVTEHHKADRFTYRGTDVEADVTYGFGYCGDVQIQLIAQHDDAPSIYRDMYAPGEFGFHHVAKYPADYDGERQRLLDAASSSPASSTPTTSSPATSTPVRPSAASPSCTPRPIASAPPSPAGIRRTSTGTAPATPSAPTSAAPDSRDRRRRARRCRAAATVTGEHRRVDRRSTSLAAKEFPHDL
jgi:hypothetical protein